MDSINTNQFEDILANWDDGTLQPDAFHDIHTEGLFKIIEKVTLHLLGYEGDKKK